MKTLPSVRSFSPFAAARLVLAALAAGGVSAQTKSDTRVQKPVVMESYVVDAAKTHTIFMGADISVNLDKDLYPVRDVVGSSWVVVIDGKEHVISAKSAPLNLKITPSLKLTEVSATIVGFKRTAAYSFANDPSTMLTRGLSEAASMDADLLSMAANAQHVADTETNKALGPMATLASSDNQFGAAVLQASAAASPGAAYSIPKGGFTASQAAAFAGQYAANVASSQAATAASAQQNATMAASQTENGNEPANGSIVTKGMDAMDVEFEISSVQPLLKPYVVTMTRFRTPNSLPGVVQTLVYARSLDPIYKQPGNVHFTEEGFPFNYELVDFQLHIYDRGVEIATNLAAKRVELTRDEAFEYVKLEYVGAHRSDTLPAAPAMGRLPAELPNRLAAGKYAGTFFVKVSKDGLADEAFADAACSRKIEDPFLETVVKSIRFMPALAHGEPVEGTAAVNLGKLAI
jgi:hypothetical protein